VEGRDGRPILEEIAEQLRKTTRYERLTRVAQLGRRPPADVVNVLGRQLDRRCRLVLVDSHEVYTFPLPEDAPVPGECVVARPQLGAQREVVEADLLEKLAAERLLDVFARADAPSRRRPPALTRRIDEPHEEHAVVTVEHQRANSPSV